MAGYMGLGGTYKDLVTVLQTILTSRYPAAILYLPLENFIIVFKRDVTTDHIIQQDAKGPHRGRTSVVPMEANPFWWAIDACTYRRHIRGNKFTYNANPKHLQELQLQV